MASSSTPSSSITTLTKKHEVFLSFRGEDTRYGFTSHLYEALCRKKIETFIDDHKLERGDEISPALLRAIEESKIAVVIFSKNYASSKWCLRELAEIIKCMKLIGLIVMPVFYHVYPTDVRRQTGSFGRYFANYEEIGRVGIFSWFSSLFKKRKEKELQEEVQKWREALTEASNLSGWDSSVVRPDAKLVGEIVETVWGKLRSKYIPSSIDFEGLVGIHERIERVMSLLCLDMENVRKIIGIWGMGGIGKTTIAQAVFKSISYKFDGACFIDEVGKKLEKKGGSELVKRAVLSEILHEENPKLNTPIRPDIMEMLNQKKVFIVLDGVDTTQIHTISPLKTFVGSLINRCGLGSRIIITSRDKQVLCNLKVDDRAIHEEKGLDDDEAHELFHKHANPTEDCMALSQEIVYYAGGNPLALEVLGLHFKGKSKQVWKSALKKLQGIVNPEIFDVLKISYDGLNEEEKKLFLDLACFEYGPYHDADGMLQKELLDCEYSLSVLIAKSLVTMDRKSGYMEMHDLLREMGREIVRRESPKNPGKRSRLWERDDVIQILKYNTGTDAVEGISLDMDDIEDIHLSSQVFDKMHNLRFLLFHSIGWSNKVHLPNGLNCLPDELRILNWHKYPLRVLPSNFNPKELVKLDLSSSNIERLWEGTKPAPKLKWLILNQCEHLTRIPNLSDFPLVVKVDLRYCKSLVDFPSSVQQHNNLWNLNMSGTAIEEVPSSIQSLTNLTELDLSKCTRLKHISTSIFKLKSLSTVDATDCTQLESFPEILGTMESLITLGLSGSAIKELPPSIGHLIGLRSLKLDSCKNLKTLPSSICYLTSLEELNLSYCSKLDKLPDNLGNLKSSKWLDVSRSGIGQLPSSITCLENLEVLDCSECRDLTILPPLSGLRTLRTLRSNNCSLMEIPEDIGHLSSLEELKLNGNMFESLPKSIKQLSKLKFLSLSDCKMLRSILELPAGLECLEATDCHQLCQVPDASEFFRCINSKSHFSTYYRHHRVDFIFTNSLNLIKAVSNVFEELLRIMQRTEKGSGKPPNEFSIYLPGNKIPEWFSYKSLESSVNFQVLRNDLVNRKFMGFVICAVFGFEEYYSRDEQYMRKQWQYIDGVHYDFETNYDHIAICNGNRSYFTHRTYVNTVYIDSDHMLLGYCSFYSSNPNKLPAGDSDCVDISIKFHIISSGGQLKCCAVHPIYAEEPIEKIGATIQEIGETSGRSDQSDDNDEEVEPYPKRICIQAINTP